MPKGRFSSIDSKRREIHRRMQRNVRLPKYMRLEQAQSHKPMEFEKMQRDVAVMQERIASEEAKPKHWMRRDLIKPTKGFIKKLFNRKVG